MTAGPSAGPDLHRGWFPADAELIRREFADVLGSRVRLLDGDGGLEILADMYRRDEPGLESRKAA